MSESKLELLAAAVFDGRLRVIPERQIGMGGVTSGYRIVVDPPQERQAEPATPRVQAEGNPNDRLTLIEVAELIRTPAATLRYWRHLGTAGPRSFKVGSRVFYKRVDVDSWIQEQYEAQ